VNISAKRAPGVFPTMLILAILRHALNDPHFKVYRDRWMLEGTLTALLNEFYNIPESLQFNVFEFKSAVSRHNFKQLSKYGFETINERTFDLNTCRVYRSDPYFSRTRGNITKARQVAFYLQDHTSNADILISPSTIAHPQPRRNTRSSSCKMEN
jgi:hypothetical protein